MKIYTRAGDDGSTGLFGGSRVSKSDLRLDAYGTVDELSAALGVAIALDATLPTLKLYERVQNELFTLGSRLATPTDSPHRDKIPELPRVWITRLENEIDSAETHLPPLTTFILPGGSQPAAALHLARTICRRAERATVRLADAEHVVIEYLNRLSDHLFVHARLANHLSHISDITWRK